MITQREIGSNSHNRELRDAKTQPELWKSQTDLFFQKVIFLTKYHFFFEKNFSFYWLSEFDQNFIWKTQPRWQKTETLRLAGIPYPDNIDGIWWTKSGLQKSLWSSFSTLKELDSSKLSINRSIKVNSFWSANSRVFTLSLTSNQNKKDTMELWLHSNTNISILNDSLESKYHLMNFIDTQCL